MSFHPGLSPHLLLLVSLAVGCAAPKDPAVVDDTAPGTTATGGRPEGEDVTVTVFDEEYIYYGDENRRTVDVAVTFPDDASTYASLTGQFRLDCPEDACDWWDRYGTFGVVTNPGATDEQYIEIDRFVTSYQVSFGWESDLTAVRPLLTGTQTLRVFIDTWVGPGHENGNGWLFSVAVAYDGGPPPSPEPIAVVPVWPHLSWSAGLDDNPVENQVLPQEVGIPEDAGQVTLRSFITGHGWNNTQNCAEFCEKEHFYTVGTEEYSRVVWRDDCNQTETDDVQQGTWRYDRAGWCPGAQVYPWDTDVTAMVGGASTVPVSYRLEDFTWAGDGDQPYYYMSGVLLVAR